MAELSYGAAAMVRRAQGSLEQRSRYDPSTNWPKSPSKNFWMALQTLTINLGKLVSKWTGFFAICECAALLKIPFLFLKRKTSLIKKRCLSKWEVYLVNCELSSWSFFLTKFLSNYPLKGELHLSILFECKTPISGKFYNAPWDN